MASGVEAEGLVLALAYRVARYQTFISSSYLFPNTAGFRSIVLFLGYYLLEMLLLNSSLGRISSEYYIMGICKKQYVDSYNIQRTP